MPYKISHRQSFVRDLKDFKQNKLQKEAILDAVKRIIENPLLGETLVEFEKTLWRKLKLNLHRILRTFNFCKRKIESILNRLPHLKTKF